MADGDRYRVRSVERAIDILEALGRRAGGANLTEIAGELKATKSGTYATLQTLLARELISSTGSGAERRYRLGLGLTRLGEHALSQVTLRDEALPILHELSDSTGLTSRAAAWAGTSAVTVAQVDGRAGIRFDLHLGQRELLHSSSVGKAMLSTLDDHQVREILRTVVRPRRTARTLTTMTELLHDLAEVRDRGFAIDDEEDAEGIICVGAAVFEHRREVCGAISVTAIKSQVTGERIAQLGAVVRERAQRLSRHMGFVP